MTSLTLGADKDNCGGCSPGNCDINPDLKVWSSLMLNMSGFTDITEDVKSECSGPAYTNIVTSEMTALNTSIQLDLVSAYSSPGVDCCALYMGAMNFPQFFLGDPESCDGGIPAIDDPANYSVAVPEILFYAVVARVDADNVFVGVGTITDADPSSGILCGVLSPDGLNQFTDTSTNDDFFGAGGGTSAALTITNFGFYSIADTNAVDDVPGGIGYAPTITATLASAGTRVAI